MTEHHRKGYRRDKLVAQAIERHGVLDTDQIWYLYFRDIKTGQRAAQTCLQRLFIRKGVKRVRPSVDQPYCYYMGRKSGQLEHRLGVNWVYVWHVLTFKKWESLHSLEYEKDYGILRADALLAIKNRWENRLRFVFIEFDNAVSGNEFDKIQKYNALYESEKYRSDWWADIAERFPPIMVVTTSRSRIKAIGERLNAENVHGLEFIVKELDRLKEECRDALPNKA